MSELDAYDYELPKHLIAQQPLAQRSDARLLVVDRRSGTLAHRHVRDLDEILAPGDCLVANDTRVVPARLVGHRRDTRGHWEGLFLTADEQGTWQLLCKTRGKLQPGEIITLEDPAVRDDVGLRLVMKLDDGVWAARPESDENVWQILDRVGRVPLPPYIRGGEMVDADTQQYQTVFARQPGAVAAPTAGLHFTDDLLKRLAARGIQSTYVTLHVGLDTFRPISVESLTDHPMHSEWGQIEASTVERIDESRRAGGRVAAVGTTSVRVLETAAAQGKLRAWSGHTNLFIRPPYEFRGVDALMTNFHLPRTTLLVLVYAFGGRDLMRRAYQEAIEQEYRFFSYGDAMLIL
jgi:S-adenosylmethionine:tRNA ribosyltransferase-isomerase